MQTIAIQGQAGSFHDAATQRFFGQAPYRLLACDSFGQVFAALAQARAERAVVAAENSLYGSIHATYDHLAQADCTIIGEVTLPVHQSLLALPGSQLADISVVLSHPAALDQCRDWLDRHLPQAQRVEHADTAGAAAEIAQAQRQGVAAIAARHAGRLYHLDSLADRIEDAPGNRTRFLVLAPTACPTPDANKASLILTTTHQPGALHQALAVFADQGCNLTKLESRPIRGSAFRYQFIIDVMTNAAQLAALTQALEQQNCSVRLLGHYQAAER